MGAPKNQIGIGSRFGDRDELCHGPQRRIQAIELIGLAAGAGSQSAEAVVGTINPAVVCEVEECGTVCGEKVQRIRYANNETNYCPICQTGGRLLADRSLSLLLKKDWPKTPEELEELRERRAV